MDPGNDSTAVLAIDWVFIAVYTVSGGALVY